MGSHLILVLSPLLMPDLQRVTVEFGVKINTVCMNSWFTSAESALREIFQTLLNEISLCNRARIFENKLQTLQILMVLPQLVAKDKES